MEKAGTITNVPGSLEEVKMRHSLGTSDPFKWL